MTFPTTPIQDNFNRSNATAIGGNWTLFGRSTYDMGISSNQAYNPDAEWNHLYYNASTYGPDCEAYFTLPTLMPQNYVFVALARFKDMTVGAFEFDGYGLQAFRWDNGGTDTMTMRLRRFTNGGGTNIGDAVSITNPPNGLKIGIECIGSALKGYYDSGSGWTLGPSTTDSTYSAAGYIGFYWDSESTGRMDDFGGGTISNTGRPTIYYSMMSR